MVGICFWLNGQNRDARYRVASIIAFVHPKIDLLTGVAARCIKIVDKIHLSDAPRIQADQSAAYEEYTTVLHRMNIENFLPQYR
jgi:hypothetical protein